MIYFTNNTDTMVTTSLVYISAISHHKIVMLCSAVFTEGIGML